MIKNTLLTKEEKRALLYCKCENDIVTHRYLGKHWEIGKDSYVCLSCKMRKTIHIKDIMNLGRKVKE